jgi:regulator of nucleoside diphosphate kinase
MNTSLNLPPIVVATDDYSRLMGTARSLADQQHPLASPLLGELLRAQLCPPDRLPTDVVSLDRFVRYRRAGEETSEYRALIHPDDRMWSPTEVSILTPLGLSLLGLKVGDRMPLLRSGGVPGEWVDVEALGPLVTGGVVPRGLGHRWPTSRVARGGYLIQVLLRYPLAQSKKLGSVLRDALSGALSRC